MKKLISTLALLTIATICCMVTSAKGCTLAECKQEAHTWNDTYLPMEDGQYHMTMYDAEYIHLYYATYYRAACELLGADEEDLADGDDMIDDGWTDYFEAGDAHSDFHEFKTEVSTWTSLGDLYEYMNPSWAHTCYHAAIQNAGYSHSYGCTAQYNAGGCHANWEDAEEFFYDLWVLLGGGG